MVSPSRDAILRLQVAGISFGPEAIDVIVDTGFTDYLTLDQQVITRLGLQKTSVARVELADGSTTLLEEFLVRVQWGDHWLEVPALASEGGSLLGMSLLYGHDLHIRVLDGGAVTVEPIR